ncbi:phytoene synthase [Allosphingosinicella indica]|uniref:Phytoene synthase n=1 Tax=Allosphingosinicella indica TaxID=941907 RepID=A0A1X7GQM3_9SPHN|nr:phytoene synthase [Allosphingosinicella indica]
MALTYASVSVREALGALWALDAALAAALGGGREPMIARIKLAWWRDALEALDTRPPPPQPELQAAAGLVEKGLSGAKLGALAEGWALLADPAQLDEATLQAFADQRGAQLFWLAATLIGDNRLPPGAGAAWALADLARHSSKREEAAMALKLAGRRTPDARWPARLRPLGMLDALARRDAARGLDRLEPPGTPARMLRMMRHRLTGR